MIIVGIFTCFIYYSQKDNLELYFNSNKNSDDNLIQKSIIEEKNSYENKI